MFHEEITLGAEREGGDGRARAEEALVVAVVGYAVGAGGVVVDEAEVVCGVRQDFCDPVQLVEAVGQRARVAGWVFVRGYGLGGRCFEEISRGREAGGLVDAEDGCVAWSVDLCFCASSLDFVLYSVEKQATSKELEQVFRDSFGNIWLKVEEIEVWLVINGLAV